MALKKKQVAECDNPSCNTQRVVEEPGDTLGYPQGIYLKPSNFITDFGMLKLNVTYICSLGCVKGAFEHAYEEATKE